MGVVEDLRALDKSTTNQNRASVESLINSLVYAQSFFESLRDLLSGLVAYRRFQKSGDASDAELCTKRMNLAQSYWNHHTQRHGSLPGVATAFREQGFWELTQEILAKVGE